MTKQESEKEIAEAFAELENIFHPPLPPQFIDEVFSTNEEQHDFHKWLIHHEGSNHPLTAAEVQENARGAARFEARTGRQFIKS